jgi:hypothetical protein
VLILLIAVMVALYFLAATEKQENPAAATPAPTRLGNPARGAAPAGKEAGHAQSAGNALREEPAPGSNTLAPAPAG